MGIYISIIYLIPYILGFGVWVDWYSFGAISEWVAHIFNPIKWGVILSGQGLLVYAYRCKGKELIHFGSIIYVGFVLIELASSFLSIFSSNIPACEVFYSKFYAFASFCSYLVTFSLPYAIYWIIKKKQVFSSKIQQSAPLKTIAFGIAILVYAMIMILYFIHDVSNWNQNETEVLPGISNFQFQVYFMSKEIGQAAIAYLLFFKYCSNVLSAKNWIISVFSILAFLGCIMIYPLKIWSVSSIMINFWWVALGLSFTSLIGYVNGKPTGKPSVKSPPIVTRTEDGTRKKRP